MEESRQSIRGIGETEVPDNWLGVRSSQVHSLRKYTIRDVEVRPWNPLISLTPKLCELRQDTSSCTKLAYSDKSKHMDVEIAMRETRVVDRTKRILRWENDTTELFAVFGGFAFDLRNI